VKQPLNRFVPVLASVVSIGALLLVAPVQAEIYKYRDAAGNIHYTDRPQKRSTGFQLLWQSGNDPRFATYSRIDVKSWEYNRRRLTGVIAQVARETGLPAELIHAVVRAESAYDPKALSKKGAQGLMQLMPATARRYGVKDSWDAEQNLRGGASYLKELLQMFDRDLELAVAAYNAGENAVKRYGNKIPPYDETRNYVRKVVKFYNQGTPRVVGAYPTIR